MITSHSFRPGPSCIKDCMIVMGLALLMTASSSSNGSALDEGPKGTQEAFATPQLAIDALVSHVRSSSTEGIMKVLGPDADRIVSSGDPTADQAARERFLAAYDEAHETTQEGESQAVLIIGEDRFPFPIPLVKEEATWRFDAAAGEEEILNRRIGENELSVIKVMQAYVDAQREYATLDRDGMGVQYARRLLSSEGKKDGLYWPVSEGEGESPLGPLVAGARAEGYEARSGSPAPYHGYVFRILEEQGSDASGGSMSYVVNGRMIGGFGLITAPAEYGNSGVMTFMINHDGTVYEKDLGPETSELAGKITVFNPDASWKKVTSE